MLLDVFQVILRGGNKLRYLVTTHPIYKYDSMRLLCSTATWVSTGALHPPWSDWAHWVQSTSGKWPLGRSQPWLAMVGLRHLGCPRVMKLKKLPGWPEPRSTKSFGSSQVEVDPSQAKSTQSIVKLTKLTQVSSEAYLSSSEICLNHLQTQ